MNTSEDDKSASSDSTNETTDEQKNTIEFRHRSEDMNIAPKEVPVDPAPGGSPVLRPPLRLSRATPPMAKRYQPVNRQDP